MLTRFASTAPAAALITGGLFLGMIGLIRAEFVPREVAENSDFSIAPVVEDIETVERSVVIDAVERVVTPPPAPRIDIQAADAPDVPIATVGGAVPDFRPIPITTASFAIIAPDADVQPLVRIPHVMPAGAERSGHCDMVFDVDPSGSPFNIRPSCSARIFQRPSVRAVQKWKYQPKIENGVAVARSGVSTRLTYDLTDDRGVWIPE